jgi:hypothetical protein
MCVCSFSRYLTRHRRALTPPLCIYSRLMQFFIHHNEMVKGDFGSYWTTVFFSSRPSNNYRELNTILHPRIQPASLSCICLFANLIHLPTHKDLSVYIVYQHTRYLLTNQWLDRYFYLNIKLPSYLLIPLCVYLSIYLSIFHLLIYFFIYIIT